MSVLPDLTPDPPDVIFDLQSAIKADSRPYKINLSIGVYQTPTKGTVLLDVVKEAERLLIAEEKAKDYLPIEGERELVVEIGKLTLGKATGFSGVQTIGGTGALSIAADFIKRNLHPLIAMPDPTWANHRAIFTSAGLEVVSYPYANSSKTGIDFAALKKSVVEMPPKSTVLFHTCCHNPTGIDLSVAQWEELAIICKEKGLFVLFDLAYQGYGGSLQEDVASVRLFFEKGIEFFLAVSFSKNGTLYSERVGALLVASPEEKRRDAIVSKWKTRIRTTYSNPPSHGAKIVLKLLKEPGFFRQWVDELETTRRKIVELRIRFADELEKEMRGADFSYLRNGKGLFAFISLDDLQLKRLVDEFAIYVSKGGRINIAGLSEETMGRIVKALAQVMQR